jgi:hypothetical protein
MERLRNKPYVCTAALAGRLADKGDVKKIQSGKRWSGGTEACRTSKPPDSDLLHLFYVIYELQFRDG